MGHWTPTGIEPTDYADDDELHSGSHKSNRQIYTLPYRCHLRTQLTYRLSLFNLPKRKACESFSNISCDKRLNNIAQRSTTFLGQGPQCITFLRTWGPKTKLWAELRETSTKGDFSSLSSLFIACDLILFCHQSYFRDCNKLQNC